MKGKRGGSRAIGDISFPYPFLHKHLYILLPCTRTSRPCVLEKRRKRERSSPRLTRFLSQSLPKHPHLRAVEQMIPRKRSHPSGLSPQGRSLSASLLERRRLTLRTQPKHRPQHNQLKRLLGRGHLAKRPFDQGEAIKDPKETLYPIDWGRTPCAGFLKELWSQLPLAFPSGIFYFHPRT